MKHIRRHVVRTHYIYRLSVYIKPKFTIAVIVCRFGIYKSQLSEAESEILSVARLAVAQKSNRHIIKVRHAVAVHVPELTVFNFKTDPVGNKPRFMFCMKFAVAAPSVNYNPISVTAVVSYIKDVSQMRRSDFCIGIICALNQIRFFYSWFFHRFNVYRLPDTARHGTRRNIPPKHMRRLADIKRFIAV